MSRTISPALKTHLAGETTTLALLWQVIRKDGQTFGFTDHDSDLIVNGVTYVAATGFNASAVSTSAAFNVDNLDVDGIFSSDAITEADILSGLWDNAEVRVYLVNWKDLTQGVMKVRRGWLGQMKTGRAVFTTELRGLMQKLQQNIGEVYTPTCRANLGDARCKVDLAAITYPCVVTAVTSRRKFGSNALTPADNIHAFGIVTWTTGLNTGLQMEVKSNKMDGTLELVLPMPYDIAVDDQFTVVAGCDRTFPTCRDRFNNVINYRGEPHLPGIDRLMMYGKNGTT